MLFDMKFDQQHNSGNYLILILFTSLVTVLFSILYCECKIHPFFSQLMPFVLMFSYVFKRLNLIYLQVIVVRDTFLIYYYFVSDEQFTEYD